MRFIHTTGLKELRNQGLGPWRVNNNTLLRTSWRGHLLKTPLAAQEVLNAYAAAWESGVGSPKPFEVVEVPGGYGVLVEYVRGAGLSLHIMLGSYSPQEAGVAMGDLAHKLHSKCTSTGLNWNAEFRSWAHGLAPLLPANMGSRLVNLADKIPESHALLHGDLHTGNVVVRSGRPVLIDMESVGFGHPVFELAIMRSRLDHNCVSAAAHRGMCKEGAEAITKEIWSAILHEYFRHMDAQELQDIDNRVLVLAEVENACFSHHLNTWGQTELTAAQLARLASLSKRLGELMP